MKTTSKLTAFILLAATAHGYADSKRTAEFLLVDPKSHVDKEVTLDVSHVKPVHWKSPLSEIAFFHAVTIDRRDGRFGGAILVAVPAGEATKFARKFGMDFDGRNSTTTLRGTFVLVSGRGPSGLWIIDTTGKLAELIAEKRAEFPAEAGKPGDMGKEPGVGGPGPGRRHPFRAGF
ncbi:MAG: hypothetical protein MUF86_06745 [Akkermansiaceae bacterium]|jgi:hypothetical protein|nr:hypothetical protein [Akkermansiaceae bacterium]